MTIGELANYPLHILEMHLGKYGEVLLQKANGTYSGSVQTYHEAKSISTERTFGENTSDQDFLHTELRRMTEKLGFELRSEGKMTRCVAIKIRYPDFETHTKQVSIHPSSYDDELLRVVKDLFVQLYKSGKPIRLLGIRFSDLVSDSVQTDLFENRVQKSKLYAAIDGVKNRFGKKSLNRGK
jgi:DNA polymerase-4